MVKRNPVPIPPHTRPNRFPLHHVMTEAEAFAALRDEIQTFRDENQLLRERLATLEEESRTHDPSPLPVPTPPVSDLPMSFREPVMNDSEPREPHMSPASPTSPMSPVSPGTEPQPGDRTGSGPMYIKFSHSA